MSAFDSAFTQTIAASDTTSTEPPAQSYSPVIDDIRPLAEQAAEYHSQQPGPPAPPPMPMPVFNPPPRPRDPLVYIVPIGVSLALVFAYFALKTNNKM